MRSNTSFRMMLLATALFIFLGLMFYSVIEPFFYELVNFSYTLLVLTVAGLILSIWQIFRLNPDYATLRELKRGTVSHASREFHKTQQSILRPLVAKILAKKTFTQKFAHSIVESAQLRLQGRQLILVFLIRAVLFIGLIGTIWGVSSDISAQDLQLAASLKYNLGPAMFGFGAGLFLSFLHVQVVRAYTAFLSELNLWLADPISVAEEEIFEEEETPPAPAKTTPKKPAKKEPVKKEPKLG